MMMLLEQIENASNSSTLQEADKTLDNLFTDLQRVADGRMTPKRDDHSPLYTIAPDGRTVQVSEQD